MSSLLDLILTLGIDSVGDLQQYPGLGHSDYDILIFGIAYTMCIDSTS